MEILWTKREWIKWCHAASVISRREKPPPKYPIAAMWLTDGSENPYPMYWTAEELNDIVQTMKNRYH